MAFTTVAAFAMLPYLEFVAAHPDEGQLTRLAVWFIVTLALAVIIVWTARSTDTRHLPPCSTPSCCICPFGSRAAANLQHRLGIGLASHLLGWIVLTLLAVMVAVPFSRRVPVRLWAALVGVAFALNAGLQATMSWTGVTTAAQASRMPVGWAERPATGRTSGWSCPMARADVPEDRTGPDNSTWLNALRDRGFDVAEEARANYPVTWVSLPAMLKMTYVLDEKDRLQRLEPLYDRLRGTTPPSRFSRGGATRTCPPFLELPYGRAPSASVMRIVASASLA